MTPNRAKRAASAQSTANEKETWTFSSSGWLFVYFFGVVKALMQTKHCENKDIYVIGSSGGACVGGLLFLPEVNIDDMVRFICLCAEDARKSIWNRFKIRAYVKGAVDKFCPDDAPERLSNRLEVSVTKLFGFQNIRWKEFDSKKDYLDAILASSCVVGLAGLPYWTKYGYLIDGGYSDFQLLKATILGTKFCSFHNGEVTSVCPFYCSRADIKPTRYVPVYWALSPPPPEELYSVFRLGFHDTLQHLHRKRTPAPRAPPSQLKSLADGPVSPRSRGSRSPRTPGAKSNAHSPFSNSKSYAEFMATSGSTPRFSDALDTSPLAHAETSSAAQLDGGGVPMDGLTDSLSSCSPLHQRRAVRLQHAGEGDIQGAGRFAHVSDDDDSGSDREYYDAPEAMVACLEHDAEEWLMLLEESMHEAQLHARKSMGGAQAKGHGLWPLLRSSTAAVAWSLVYCELLLQTQLATALLWISPLLARAHSERNVARALFCWGSVFNVRLLLKTMPVLGSGVKMQGNTAFERELEQMSFMYRFLFYLL